MPQFAFMAEPINYRYRNDKIISSVFHSHPHYEVYYFHAGQCTYLIGDKIYSLSPGDLILMNGMTLHCPKLESGSEYVRSVVHFDPAGLQPFLKPQYALNILELFQQPGNYRFSLRGSGREEAERMLLYMHSLYVRNDPIGYNRFMLAFVDFLYFIYEQCQQPLEDRDEPAPSEKEKAVQSVIAYLEQNYAEDLHLEHLQEHLHLNKFYLSKLFKEVTGVTIFYYLLQRRINQAKIQFVLDSGLSVTEAGFQVGFKHLSHFSRVFKQQVGLTPEQYKASVRAAGPHGK